MNLIKKLSKALATASLATAMVVAPLTACNNTNTNQPNEQEGGYSQLLMDVLKSDYYTNLIKSSDKEYSVPNTPDFDPHPYGFLSQHGHNISAIKNGDLICETICYIKKEDNKNFYVNTRVEKIDKFGDYFTCYTLKYSITDKEYEDLHKMHGYQTAVAAFMVQELSKQKTPKIESEMNITKDAYEGLTKSLNSYKKCIAPFDDKQIEFDPIDFSVKDQYIVCALRNKVEYKSAIQSAEIRTINCIPIESNIADYSVSVIENSNIYSWPYRLNFTTEEYEKYLNSTEEIIYFESQHLTLGKSENIYLDAGIQI